MLLPEDAAAVRLATVFSNSVTFSSSLSFLPFKETDGGSKGLSSRLALAAGPGVRVKAGGGCLSFSLSVLAAAAAAVAAAFCSVVFVAAEVAMAGLALFSFPASAESADIGFILSCMLLLVFSVFTCFVSSVLVPSDDSLSDSLLTLLEAS